MKSVITLISIRAGMITQPLLNLISERNGKNLTNSNSCASLDASDKI
jgi:hypothetical protein